MGMIQVTDSKGMSLGTYAIADGGPAVLSFSVNGSMITLQYTPSLGRPEPTVRIPQLDDLNANLINLLLALQEEIAFWRIRATELEKSLQNS